MRAHLGQADAGELIRIEGTWYFPPERVEFTLLAESATPYHCSWKGECTYYSVVVDGQTLPDRAWTYLAPLPSAVEKVGRDFSGYVAFWKEAEVTA